MSDTPTENERAKSALPDSEHPSGASKEHAFEVPGLRTQDLLDRVKQLVESPDSLKKAVELGRRKAGLSRSLPFDYEQGRVSLRLYLNERRGELPLAIQKRRDAMTAALVRCIDHPESEADATLTVCALLEDGANGLRLREERVQESLRTASDGAANAELVEESADLRLSIDTAESLSATVSNYMRLMEMYSSLKNRGMTLPKEKSSLDQTALEHFALFRSVCDARVHEEVTLVRLQALRKTSNAPADVEKQIQDSTKRIITCERQLVRLFECKEAGVPGANAEGVPPVVTAIITMLQEDRRVTFEKFRSLKTMQKRKVEAERRGQHDVEAETAVAETPALNDRYRANLEFITDYVSLTNAYLTHIPQVGAFSPLFRGDMRGLPMDVAARKKEREDMSQFLRDGSVKSLDALVAQLDTVEQSVLPINDSLPVMEDMARRVGFLQASLAESRTLGVLNTPAEWIGAPWTAKQHEGEVDELVTALGWPRNADGRPKSPEELTPQEQKQMDQKRKSLREALEVFSAGDPPVQKKYRESLVTFRDMAKDDYWKEVRADAAPQGKELPENVRITSNEQAKELVRQGFDRRSVLACAARQFALDSRAFDEKYCQLLGDIHNILGIHFNTEAALASFYQRRDMTQEQQMKWIEGIVMAGFLVRPGYRMIKGTARWVRGLRGAAGTSEAVAETELAAGAAGGARWVRYGGLAAEGALAVLDTVDALNKGKAADEAEKKVREGLEQLRASDEKHFICDDPKEGAYRYVDDNNNLLFKVSLADMHTRAAETAAWVRAGADTAALISLASMTAEAAAGPPGWIVLGIQVVVVKSVELWEYSQYYNFVKNCPPWLLVRIGGTGVIGKTEHELMDDTLMDKFRNTGFAQMLGLSEKSPEIRKRLLFSAFMRYIAERQPDVAEVVLSELDTPAKTQEFFEQDFEKVIMPFFSVQLFLHSWLATYDWADIKNLQIDQGTFNTIDKKDVDAALRNSGELCAGHLIEKRRKRWQAELAALTQQRARNGLDVFEAKRLDERISILTQALYRQGFTRVFDRSLRSADAELSQNGEKTRHELFVDGLVRRLDAVKGNTWREKKYGSSRDGEFALSDKPGIMTDYVPFNGGKGINPREDDVISNARTFSIDTSGIHGLERRSTPFVARYDPEHFPSPDGVLRELPYIPSLVPALYERAQRANQRRQNLMLALTKVRNDWYQAKRALEADPKNEAAVSAFSDCEARLAEYLAQLRECEEEFASIRRSHDELLQFTQRSRKDVANVPSIYIDRSDVASALLKLRPGAEWLKRCMVFISWPPEQNGSVRNPTADDVMTNPTDRAVLLRAVDSAASANHPVALHVRKSVENGRTIYHVIIVDSYNIVRDDPKQVNILQQGFEARADGAILEGMQERAVDASIGDHMDVTVGEARAATESRARAEEVQYVRDLRDRKSMYENLRNTLWSTNTFVQIGKDSEGTPMYAVRTKEDGRPLGKRFLFLKTTKDTIQYQLIPIADFGEFDRDANVDVAAVLKRGEWKTVGPDLVSRLGDQSASTPRNDDLADLARSLTVPNEVDSGSGSSVHRLLYLYPYSDHIYARFLPMLISMYGDVGNGVNSPVPQEYEQQVKDYMRSTGQSGMGDKSPARQAFLDVMLSSLTETKGLRTGSDAQHMLDRLNDAASKGKFGKADGFKNWTQKYEFRDPIIAPYRPHTRPELESLEAGDVGGQQVFQEVQRFNSVSPVQLRKINDNGTSRFGLVAYDYPTTAQSEIAEYVADHCRRAGLPVDQNTVNVTEDVRGSAWGTKMMCIAYIEKPSSWPALLQKLNESFMKRGAGEKIEMSDASLQSAALKIFVTTLENSNDDLKALSQKYDTLKGTTAEIADQIIAALSKGRGPLKITSDGDLRYGEVLVVKGWADQFRAHPWDALYAMGSTGRREVDWINPVYAVGTNMQKYAKFFSNKGMKTLPE